MPEERYKWDFFLAHAGPDLAAAEQLYVLLEPHSKVFLDSRCLMLGDDWDQELASAQINSMVSVVLVSSRTDGAYYQREEIAAAIDLARKNRKDHRVVPVYLDDALSARGDIPYGLRLKHGLSVAEAGDFQPVAVRLIDLLKKLEGNRVKREEIVQSSKSALSKLTEGSGKERLDGMQEITKIFRPVVRALLSILIISVILIAFCLFTPSLGEKLDRALAISILASMCAITLACLMLVFTKSINVAREIVQDELTHR
jgi:TIR domain